MPKITVVTPSIRPSGLVVMQECLKNQSFQDFEWLVEINYSGEHDLNAAFNKMIKKSKGELIVFYQDYTKIKKDGLQKFWDAYQKDKDTLFTAPLGKVHTWGKTPKWDWRLQRGNIEWNELELDWGAIPKHILEDIGGFDERLDQWWSMDNVSVGKRAQLCGYKFKNLRDNLSCALDHDAMIEHPFRKNYAPEHVNVLINGYESSPRLDYLL